MDVYRYETNIIRWKERPFDVIDFNENTKRSKRKINKSVLSYRFTAITNTKNIDEKEFFKDNKWKLKILENNYKV